MSLTSAPLSTLEDWLAWQLRIHPREIELGLDRVREVWKRLGAPAPAGAVITVGGTNGKGSTVAFLEAMLRAGGQRVGAFTSPHLLRYNERVRIDGADASDAELIAAFARIEVARREIPLTYFEFGTLAALIIFASHSVDVALLEVGLGGRLDAVNIVDADVAIVTTVDLDHQDWLGNDREAIAREKAGIFRCGHAAIIGDAAPPLALLAEAHRIGAPTISAGQEFHIAIAEKGWVWRADGIHLDLPDPGLNAPCQRANAASAIAALHALRNRIEFQPSAIVSGVASARIPARLQRFSGSPELVVDVAHNPQAATVLAEWLAANPPVGRNIAVFGALADKDVAGIAMPLLGHFATWHLAGLDGESPRGLDPLALRQRIDAVAEIEIGGVHATAAVALRDAFSAARADDRVVAFGSFFIAAAALMHAQRAETAGEQEGHEFVRLGPGGL